jgi:cell division septum initiation protein DivIVA
MAADEDDVPADPAIRGKGRRWRKARFAETDRLLYAGLGERVEKILRLAEAEAEDLREAARMDAAAIIEAAERDAARIRAKAQAMRDGVDEQR